MPDSTSERAFLRNTFLITVGYCICGVISAAISFHQFPEASVVFAIPFAALSWLLFLRRPYPGAVFIVAPLMVVTWMLSFSAGSAALSPGLTTSLRPSTQDLLACLLAGALGGLGLTFAAWIASPPARRGIVLVVGPAIGSAVGLVFYTPLYPLCVSSHHNAFQPIPYYAFAAWQGVMGAYLYLITKTPVTE